MIRVRPLVDADLDAAARIHRRVLDMEFLSRFGPSFMRTYYGAWIHSTGSLALAAHDEDGRLVGALLGATDPAAHARAMVRHHGAAIATKLLAYALARPRLAKELIATRGWRYTRGLVRLVRSRFASSSAAPVADLGPVVGEITHVLVSPDARGRGVGRALVQESVDRARTAGVEELTLVTPPDMAARHFYEHLGWHCDGAMQSHSGEEFLRFHYLVG